MNGYGVNRTVEVYREHASADPVGTKSFIEWGKRDDGFTRGITKAIVEIMAKSTKDTPGPARRELLPVEGESIKRHIQEGIRESREDTGRYRETRDCW